MIEIRDLRVDYEQLTAVIDLSLKIEPGTVYGLIGPNGAGKTSTMKVLATLLEPTYGEVKISGIDVLENPREAHRLLGYMPDVAPLYDDLPVQDFLEVFGIAHEIPASLRGQRIAQVLELTDLVGKREALVGSLSRGMKQRLVLSKTLLHDPQVLILDEPASGLDPMARIQLRDVLKRLGAMGKTLLVSSHILSDLSDFCSAIGIMERGRLKVSGRIDDILTRMNPHRSVDIRLVAPDPRLETIALEDPRVRAIAVEGDKARLDFDGDAAGLAELLQRLVAGGLRIQGFHERRDDIEDIFMKVGARQVS